MAIEVLAAISAAVTTINAVKGWLQSLESFIQDYQAVGKTLIRLYVDFAMYGSELALWARLWGIRDGVTRRYLSELWHENDVATIEAQLTSIQCLCEEFDDVLREFILSQNPFPQSSPPAVHLGAQLHSERQRVNEFYTQARNIKSALPPLQIREFIEMQGPRLSTFIQDIQKRITILKSISLASYSEKHATVLSSTFKSEDIGPAKSATRSKMVLDTKLASRALYRSLYEMSQQLSNTVPTRAVLRYVNLDLDLIKSKEVLDDDDLPTCRYIVLRFYLLLCWPSRSHNEPLELAVEGPLFLETGGSTNPDALKPPESRMLDACYAALLSQSSNFHCQPGPILFRSTVPHSLQKITTPPRHDDANSDSEIETMDTLQSLLYHLDAGTFLELDRYFPRSERIYLALQVAESGLVLSGTSWLSKLRSDRIQRAKSDGKKLRFFLETEASRKGPLDEDHEQITMHIFAIGIILVEIGVGHRFVRLDRSGSRNFEFLLCDDDSGTASQTWTKEEIIQELKVIIALKYANAVDFCLRWSRSEPYWKEIRNQDAERQKTAHQKITQDYYEFVYKPLKSLFDGDDLDGDGPLNMMSF